MEGPRQRRAVNYAVVGGVHAGGEGAAVHGGV